VERQQKYLARLPDNYAFPLFNASQALESQRRSGYRNTAAAAREIVDNAMEAGASRVDICFARPKQLKAHQRAESINAVAFIDNGSGMIPKMAQYALSWGSGTHFDEPSFIGKWLRSPQRVDQPDPSRGGLHQDRWREGDYQDLARRS
jgi:hypothetical protein